MTLLSLGEHDDKRNKSWAPVGEETVLAALERIVDSAHYPVLITCNTGKHRTGDKYVPGRVSVVASLFFFTDDW